MKTGTFCDKRLMFKLIPTRAAISFQQSETAYSTYLQLSLIVLAISPIYNLRTYHATFAREHNTDFREPGCEKVNWFELTLNNDQ